MSGASGASGGLGEVSGAWIALTGAAGTDADASLSLAARLSFTCWILSRFAARHAERASIPLWSGLSTEMRGIEEIALGIAFTVPL